MTAAVVAFSFAVTAAVGAFPVMVMPAVMVLPVVITVGLGLIGEGAGQQGRHRRVGLPGDAGIKREF